MALVNQTKSQTRDLVTILGKSETLSTVCLKHGIQPTARSAVDVRLYRRAVVCAR